MPIVGAFGTVHEGLIDAGTTKDMVARRFDRLHRNLATKWTDQLILTRAFLTEENGRRWDAISAAHADVGRRGLILEEARRPIAAWRMWFAEKIRAEHEAVLRGLSIPFDFRRKRVSNQNKGYF